MKMVLMVKSREELEQMGTTFENHVAIYLKSNFQNCRIIHDKSIYSPFLGKETQIDLIFICNNLVAVIEVKDWVKTVRGDYSDTHWVAKSRGANSIYHFNVYNQNVIHVRSLRNALRRHGLNPVPFANVICFPDGVELLTDCKEAVTLSQLAPMLEKLIKKSKVHFDTDDMYNLIERVEW